MSSTGTVAREQHVLRGNCSQATSNKHLTPVVQAWSYARLGKAHVHVYCLFQPPCEIVCTVATVPSTFH